MVNLHSSATFSRPSSRGKASASLVILLLATCLAARAAPSDQRTDGADGASTGESQSLLREKRHEPALTVEQVRLICKDKKVLVSSVDDMKRTIMLASISIGRADQLCSDFYLSSLTELDAILKVPPAELCSDKMLDLVKSYHFRFISPPRDVNRLPSQFDPLPRQIVRRQLHPEPGSFTIQLDEFGSPLMIPISVRHFFLKFALQISGHCKQQLLANLETDSQRLLDENDFAVIDLFNKATPIGEMLSKDMSDMDFDTVLYLPELEGERNPGDAELVSKKVYLRSSASDEQLEIGAQGQTSSLAALVETCQTKFKPIYERLIMPVIHLTKLGYDYQGDRLSKQERVALTGDKLKSWLAIVHICELFDRVVLVRDAPQEEGQGEEHQDRQGSSADGTAPADGDGRPPEGTLGGPELTVSRMSDSEVAARARQDQLDSVEASGAATLQYEPSRVAPMDGSLWVVGARELDHELSKKRGNKDPFGFKGFLRRSRNWLRRQLSRADPNRFAHYRRNALWYAGVFNFISALSNIASITMTNVLTFG